MVKIYIASDFTLIPKIKKVCEVLEDAGHEVLVKWWSRLALMEKFQTFTDDEFYDETENRNAYEMDFEGVMECDVLLFVADDEPKYYGGANVELGIALGNQKRCMSIGRLRKSAMYYPVYRAKDMTDVLCNLSFLDQFIFRSKQPEEKEHEPR